MLTETQFKHIRNLIYGHTPSVKLGLKFLSAFSKQKGFENIRASVHKNYVRLYWEPNESFPVSSRGKNVSLFPIVLLSLLDLGIVDGKEIQFLKFSHPTTSILSSILTQTPNLKYICCDFSDAQTFPKCIIELTKLICIKTNLSFVPKQILEMPSLEKIVLPNRSDRVLQNHSRYAKLIPTRINTYRDFYRLKASREYKHDYIGGLHQIERTIVQRISQIHKET